MRLTSRTILPGLITSGAVFEGPHVHCDEQQLYALTDEEYFKIGISSDPHLRLRQLQTGHPKKLRSAFRVSLPAKADVPAIEKRIHKALSPWRAPGGQEWFLFTPESEKAFRVALWAELKQLNCGMRGFEEAVS